MTQYGYDGAGRLVAKTDANGAVTQYGYDAVGDVVSQTDGRNNTKSWRYDVYGREVAELNANGVLVKTNGYDAEGRLTAQWTGGEGADARRLRREGQSAVGTATPRGTVSYGYDLLEFLLTGMSDRVGIEFQLCQFRGVRGGAGVGSRAVGDGELRVFGAEPQFDWHWFVGGEHHPRLRAEAAKHNVAGRDVLLRA